MNTPIYFNAFENFKMKGAWEIEVRPLASHCEVLLVEIDEECS